MWCSLWLKSRRNFLPCPVSLVAVLSACSRGTHTFSMSTGNLLQINYSLLHSAFRKSSTYNFHVLNPGLGRLCCVWGVMFHHSFPPLLSQVGHSSSLTDGLFPCLAAQLLVCQITESYSALGTRQWQPHSSQPVMHSSMEMPGFTSTNSPHHGLGHGGVSPAMHSHPSSSGSPGLGRNPLLVQREFEPPRRERSKDPWARAGEKQGFKLYIDSRKQTPLSLSPLKVCACLSVVKQQLRQCPQ